MKVFDTGTPRKQEAEEKPVKTFDGPGRGRKQCSGCESYVGVRNKLCLVCGTEFIKRKKVSVAKPKKELVERPKPRVGAYPPGEYNQVITIPSGKSPYKLVGHDEETVIAWAKKIRGHYLDKNEMITNEGIRYYSRQFYDVFSDEYKIICSILSDEAVI